MKERDGKVCGSAIPGGWANTRVCPYYARVFVLGSGACARGSEWYNAPSKELSCRGSGRTVPGLVIPLFHE